MAIAFVQTASKIEDNGGNAIFSSVSASFPSAVSTGDLICVGGQWDPAGTPIASVTDNSNNTYTLIVSGGTAQIAGMWYAKNVTGRSNFGVTMSFSALTDYVYMIAGEWSGLDTTSPFETASLKTDFTNPTTANAASSSKVVAQANDLLIGLLVDTTNGTTTTTAGTGWVLRGFLGNGDAGLAMEDITDLVTGNTGSMFTLAAAHTIDVAFAAFKPATGAAAYYITAQLNNCSLGNARWSA